jgi:hypothetical protein
MADLGDDIEKLEGLADRRLKLFGYSFTPTQLGIALAGISSVVGTLYGGFLMYQRVEEIANLDVGAFEQRMELIEQKVTSVDENIYAVKNDLKTDIRRIEKIADSVERSSKEANRDLNNELRAFRQEMKQLDKDVTTRLSETEKALSDKLQKALDNPLAQ